jgi:hypothetical protein
VLVCVECGCVSDDEAHGWRAYREDVPCEDDQPSLAISARAVRRGSSIRNLPPE